MGEFNRALQALALLSCAASLTVMVTLLAFRSMREKMFMRVVTFISVADLFGNISYVFLSRPREGTLACQLQGFCNTYFYPASWVWTTILTYYLYSLASTGSIPFSESLAHIVGWGLPLVLALLVLTTNNYERYKDDDNHEICTIGPDNLSAFVWHITLYYGFFLLCVVLMGMWHAKILWLRRKGKTAVSARLLSLAIESLQLYPIAMCISWLPEIVAFIIQYHRDNDDAYDGSMSLRILNGFMTALIFFWKSPQARHAWCRLLFFTSTPQQRATEMSMSSGGRGESVDEFGEAVPRKTLLEHTFLGFEDLPAAPSLQSMPSSVDFYA